jgi:hypothetical protein
MDNLKCGKCGNTTSIGFILEIGHYNALSVSQWIEGKPEKSFWGNGLKLDGKAEYPVTAYRCTSCGHLEFYADAQVERNTQLQGETNTFNTSNLVESYRETDQNSFECINCETTVPIDAKVCPNCGLDFYPPEEPPMVDKTL